MKQLVQELKDSYDSLPKKSYACEMTRTNKGVCYTPGKDVDLAFDALLKELRTYSVRDLQRDRSPLAALALLIAAHLLPVRDLRRKSSWAITAEWSSTPSRSATSSSPRLERCRPGAEPEPHGTLLQPSEYEEARSAVAHAVHELV